MTVQVKCKNCGNMAPADQFKIDYRFGFVVCPVCQKSNKGKKAEPLRPVKKKEEQVKTGPRKQRPVGWDEDDVLLDKLWKEKQHKKGILTKVGAGIMRYTCGKCNYSFTFREDRQPNSCPYCNSAIGG